MVSVVVGAAVAASVGLITWGTALAIAGLALSVVSQQKAAERQREMQRRMQEEAARRADEAKGIQIVTEGEPKTLSVIYGRVMIGGNRVYHRTFNTFTHAEASANAKIFKASTNLDSTVSGSKHEFLIVQQAMCFSGINDIIAVDIDGRKIDGDYVNSFDEVVYPTDTSNLPEGVKKVEPYSYGAKVICYLDGSIADPVMVANDAQRVTATFTNTAYATCVYRLNRDDPQFTQGTPSANFYVEGMKVKSVTKTGSVYSLSAEKTYSNNPSLVLLDYLTNTVYGRGLDISQIDLESFYNTAQVCDRVVQSNVPLEGSYWRRKNTPRSIKLFECNLSLDSTNTIRDNIEKILETMPLATLIWSSGQYKLNCNVPYVYSASKTYQAGDLVQYTSGGNVELYKAVTSVTNNTPTSNNPAYTDGVHFRINDSHIIRSDENSISWPNAQARLNYAIVRFSNEARDFTEDSVAWPPKKSTVDGTNIDRGTWDAATAYNKSDIITYNSKQYQLIYGVNRVSATTPDTDNMWIAYNVSTVYDIFLAEDNGVPLETDVFGTGIVSYYSALEKAEQLVRQSRISVTYELVVNKDFIEAEPGDFVKVTSEVLNIPNELMQITEVAPASDGNIKLSLLKFDAATYAWEAKDNEVVPPRNLYRNVPDNLLVTDLSSIVESTGDRISFNISGDARVTTYFVYTTQSIIEPISWTERARVDANMVDSGVINVGLRTTYEGSYYFTVVPAIGSAKALKSGWPIKQVLNKIPSIDFNSISIVTDPVQDRYLLWNALTDPRISAYQLYVTDAYTGNVLTTDWTEVAETSSNTVKLPDTYKTAYHATIRVKSKAGFYSELNESVAIPISYPYQNPVTGFSANIVNNGILLKWDKIENKRFAYFEVSYGNAPGVPLATIATLKSTELLLEPIKVPEGQTSKTIYYFISAVDINGEHSLTTTSTSKQISIPPAVSITQTVIDNNVLLYWTPSASDQTIRTYEIRKGSTFGSSVSLGEKSGLFTTFFETIGGNFTYWIIPIDIAGNRGTERSVPVIVETPADYVLRNNFDLTLSSGSYNTAILNNTTYYNNYYDMSYADPEFIDTDVLINNGGYFQDTIDMGWGTPINIVASNCKVSVEWLAISGSPTVSCLIGYSSDNIAWTDTAGFETGLYNFRYIRVRLSVSGGQVQLRTVNIRLSTRTIQQSGNASISSAGTSIAFTKPFVDVHSIIVTPKGTVLRTAIYDFNDVGMPVNFTVYLFDSAGNPVAGDVSYIVSGVA